ncbi:hypothetical protein PCANC_18352 [Puccinia coronata f. sp. avenae]|uniref:Myb/SANT-like domain-containing protein n=1 Tax=Puccinia coronata f. sp. avenae TaxID=200324 RepID=A0A2N5SN60_9BASI|nr:hypothetical protein PCANC_18352 [Puccinia coronata f. sp. avenae]
MRLLAQLASSLEETQAKTGGKIPKDGGKAPKAGDKIPEDGGVAPDNEGKDPSEDEDPAVHPDNKTFAQPKKNKSGTQNCLLRTGPMEVMMLDLYVQEVKKGKRSDSGFQSSTHQFVAQELRKAFPDVDQLLTHVKVKSKLSQSAKRDYNAFVACKAASGFGWDKLTCEVTASNDMWEKYLGSHPNAKKFQGVPFPEFWKLEIIFGSLAATGQASQSVSQLGLVLPDNIDTSMEGEGNPVPLPTQPSPNPTPSPTNYLSHSHTKKDNVAFALEGLTGYLMQQQDCADECTRQHDTEFAAIHAASQALSQSVNSQSNVQRAIALYQESHASKGSQQEALAAFKVLQDEVNAQVFITINKEGLK